MVFKVLGLGFRVSGFGVFLIAAKLKYFVGVDWIFISAD